MAALNPETRALYTRLQELLGDEHAETLMTYLPAEPGTELATRADIARLEGRFDALDQRFEGIDQRFEGIDQRFERIDQRFERIDQRFERLDDRLLDLHEALNRQYKNYSITMIGGMSVLTAIYAGLLAILAFAIAA